MSDALPPEEPQQPKQSRFARKGGWKGFFRRMAIYFGAILLLLILFYWWQPNRIDLVQRRPDPPLPRFPISQSHLLEKSSRVLIVTAHPDDEAYYIGGTLFALKESKATTSLIALTNGDKAYYFFNDSKRTADIRKKELVESAATVGISQVSFFEGPDGRLSPNDEVIDRLAKAIQEFKPTHILGFDADYPPRISHRDHRVAGEIVQAAAKKSKHPCWLMLFSTFGSNTALDVSKDWDRAQTLLGIHKSQFYGDKLIWIQNTVTNNAISAGEKYEMGYAEPFRAYEVNRR